MVEEALGKLLRDVAKEAATPKPKNKVEDLRDRVIRLHQRCQFHSGDIVKWKAGMKNRRFPEEEMPAIVMEVLPTPVFDTEKKDAGSPYYREPLDVVIGICKDDGDIVKFHYDSRRFASFDEGGKTLGAESKIAKLRKMVAEFNTKTTFAPGDVVVWKAGLRNRQRPNNEELCVVMELVPIRRRDDLEAGTQSFNEPLDMKVGMLEPDGDIIVVVVDSRRFKKL